MASLLVTVCVDALGILRLLSHFLSRFFFACFLCSFTEIPS
jgi:hypothetical protein